jgi:hypothetical protein
MRQLSYLLVFILLFQIPTNQIHAEEEDKTKVEITSHKAGEAIRGIVPILGTTTVENLLSWELTFSYVSNTTGTWFLISEGSNAISNEILTEWDTTAITDGVYNLRLTVYLKEGRRTHFILPDIRVRNYTPIESNTPVPSLTSTPLTVTPQPSFTPSITLSPTNTTIPDTPTPQPTNPIEISAPDITNSLTRGAGFVLIAFLILGVYGTIRKWLRNL